MSTFVESDSAFRQRVSRERWRTKKTSTVTDHLACLDVFKLQSAFERQCREDKDAYKLDKLAMQKILDKHRRFGPPNSLVE